jgi:hypothetical protein
MKVIFIMYLVYGIGNKTFYGCIYRKIKDPHILDELWVIRIRQRRRIDNRMTKKKSTKGQTTIY